MIRGLINLAIYFGIGALMFKYVNRILINMGKQPLSLGRKRFFFQSRKENTVLEICSRCGHVKERSHRCH